MRAFVLVNVGSGRADAIKQKVGAMAGCRPYLINGIYDIFVEIEVESKDALHALVIDIRKLQGVQSTITLLGLDI